MIEQQTLDAEKAKEILCNTIKVKESVLEQVEKRIATEKESWDKTSRTLRSQLDSELKKQRNDAKEKIKTMQEHATAAMNRLSKQLQCKHDNAFKQLSERANLVELLHIQLSKVVEQTDEKRKSIDDLIKYHDVAISKETEEQRKEVDKMKVDLENKKKNIEVEIEKLNRKKESLIGTERKLKDYAQVLKKQGQDMKQREQDVQHAARLLSQEKNEKINDDNQLKKMVEEEQNKNRELLECLKKLEGDINSKEELILQLQEVQQNSNVTMTQQKLRELAQQLEVRNEHLTQKMIHWEETLKEKEDKLMQERLQLEQKLSKYNECETRLAEWQKSLEDYAADLAQRE